MDSYLLRLVLLVLGVLLVVGIYLWDRVKRNKRRSPPLKMSRKLEEPNFDIPDRDDDIGEVRVVSRGNRAASEPFIETPAEVVAEPEPEANPGLKTAKPEQADEVPRPIPEPIAEPAPAGSPLNELGLQLDEAAKPARQKAEPVMLQAGDELPAVGESQFTLDLEFNAHGDSDYLNIDPALLDEVPRLIVQINVMSRRRPFSAQQILYATAQVELNYGEMNIYHRQTDAGQVLFSMASVVEPGTFPGNADESFSTPGLSMFTQLPGARDGLAIYADMLFTAERLSALLDAVLQDESRSKLTKQSIEHTREKILEHRHQIELLRRRR